MGEATEAKGLSVVTGRESESSRVGSGAESSTHFKEECASEGNLKGRWGQSQRERCR